METSHKPIRILLQTTIVPTSDDWGIERFDLLRQHLASQKDANGQTLFDVTARNREDRPDGNDPVLSGLAESDFDELWLFAVDTGNGLGDRDVAGINAFLKRGGGIMASRDHQDLGCSLYKLDSVGTAQFFHTLNPDPEKDRLAIDDTYTTTISWPNYHSGSNGDYQTITVNEPVHPLLQKEDGQIQFFPSHPHEGAVGVPTGNAAARVIATGHSKLSGRPFNLLVAFERSEDNPGRAVADSSFHHFADYNWDIRRGAPSFVSEPIGDALTKTPQALDDIKTYVRNLGLWLAPA